MGTPQTKIGNSERTVASDFFSFIHWHLLSTYHVPGARLCAKDAMVNKVYKIPATVTRCPRFPSHWLYGSILGNLLIFWKWGNVPRVTLFPTTVERKGPFSYQFSSFVSLAWCDSPVTKSYNHPEQVPPFPWTQRLSAAATLRFPPLSKLYMERKEIERWEGRCMDGGVMASSGHQRNFACALLREEHSLHVNRMLFSADISFSG